MVLSLDEEDTSDLDLDLLTPVAFREVISLDTAATEKGEPSKKAECQGPAAENSQKSGGKNTTMTPTLAKLSVQEMVACESSTDNGEGKITPGQLTANQVPIFVSGHPNTPKRGERRKKSPTVTGSAKKRNLSEAFNDEPKPLPLREVTDEVYASPEKEGR